MTNLRIKIYSDGADLEKMIADYQGGRASGFTTNPTLMKKAGVMDYVAFAKAAVTAIPDLPISFEVFADDFETMEKEAVKIASFGANVYVKLPIVTTKGESAIPLITKLSSQGISLNITAIMTLQQVKETVAAFSEGTTNVVSVFAGRIADTGVDPLPIMEEAVKVCRTKAGTELLWASTRELLNIFQADQVGADIITSPPEILAKMGMVGMDLNQLSIETVKMFNRDSRALGFTIL